MAMFGVACAGGGVLLGCGGGGSSSSNPLTCGPTYLTPNYVSAIDPGDNTPNEVLTWSEFPIRLYIKNTVSHPSTVATTDEHALEGAARWTNASNGQANFVRVSTESQAQVTFEVATLPSPVGSGGTLGYTEVMYFPSSRRIVSARVVVNVWNGMTADQFNKGLKNTITHEFGHALFMQGHSDADADVMYFQGELDLDNVLTSRDVNSFLTAYCGTFRSRATRSLPGEKPVMVRIECKNDGSFTETHVCSGGSCEH